MNLIQLIKVIDTDDVIHILSKSNDYYSDSMHVDYCNSGTVPVKYAECEVKRLYLDCGTICIEVDYKED